jgi:hypothetical protein
MTIQIFGRRLEAGAGRPGVSAAAAVPETR